MGYEIERGGEDGCARCVLRVGPEHLNRHGILHGGVAAMLLDVACGNTAGAMFDAGDPPLVLTVSLSTQFVAPARAGQVVATGRPAGGGARLAYVTGELRDDRDRLIATAAGVFKRGPKDRAG